MPDPSTLPAKALIRAVFFDMEGTLTHAKTTAESLAKASRALSAHLGDNGVDLDETVVREVVRDGFARFEALKAEQLRDIPPSHLWPEMIFKTFDPVVRDKVRLVADDLSRLWEEQILVRRIRRDVAKLLGSLRDKGYKLGLVSNVLHGGRARAYLEEKGLAQYFSAIVLSQEIGYRKPHPVIFQEAARLIGIHPRESAFVGDTVSRDIVGAQKAGFGYTILIRSEMTMVKDAHTRSALPDITVPDLQHLPGLLANLSRQGRLFEEQRPGH